jgi:Fur family transcriptional regulator, ferric uptake regulator
MTRAMGSDLHGTVESRLHSVGQRYTPKRRSLVEALRRAGRPVSTADLLSGRRTLPQSSVYRNLAVLEQAGVVRRVITEDDFSRYELTEDLTEHHHHLICSNCGRIEDVAMPATFERALDRQLDGLAREAGFATVSHRLDMIGLCRDCG